MPFSDYHKETGEHPIVGTTAEESEFLTLEQVVIILGINQCLNQ